MVLYDNVYSCNGKTNRYYMKVRYIKMGWVVIDVNGNEYGYFNNSEDAYELADTIEGSAVYEEEED